MAVYRQVYMKFWNEDPKVVEDFTPEDKYFYLYLLTNPHTTLTGVYEISDKTMARETGYNEETVKRLRERMERVHHVICYEPVTREILIPNWHRYNWTSSDKLIAAVLGQLKLIKCDDFRKYIEGLANGDTVSIPYRYTMDTSISISISDSVSNTVSNTVQKSNKKEKHKYGEYKHVQLSDDDMDKLKALFPNDLDKRIKALDEYIEETGKVYKNHYLTITRWAKEDEAKKPQPKREGYRRV